MVKVIDLPLGTVIRHIPSFPYHINFLGREYVIPSVNDGIKVKSDNGEWEDLELLVLKVDCKRRYKVVNWVSGEVRIPNQPPPYNDNDQPVCPK